MGFPKPLPKEVVDELVYLETMRSAQHAALLRLLVEVALAAGVSLDVNRRFLELRVDELRKALAGATGDGALASRLFAELEGHGG
jgi:hypothetical protein